VKVSLIEIGRNFSSCYCLINHIELFKPLPYVNVFNIHLYLKNNSNHYHHYIIPTFLLLILSLMIKRWSQNIFPRLKYLHTKNEVKFFKKLKSKKNSMINFLQFRIDLKVKFECEKKLISFEWCLFIVNAFLRKISNLFKESSSLFQLHSTLFTID
jgi:hypothetical protein